MLNPQYYNATTLPADFDVTKGHPVFAAMAAPLENAAARQYRLNITAVDKSPGRSAARRGDFPNRGDACDAAGVGACWHDRSDATSLLQAVVLHAVAAGLETERTTPVARAGARRLASRAIRGSAA